MHADAEESRVRLSGASMSPLSAPTPPGWAAVALADFDAFLKDHASCERKATASAMAFVSRYSEKREITEPMAALAREELEHFLQVYRLILKRGATLGPDDKDPYVNDLLKVMRMTPRERLLDRLLCSCLIEARSAERLQLVAEAMADAELKGFYARLARAEAGHYVVFHRIALALYPTPEVAEALARVSAHEAKVMASTPWRSAVH